MFVEKQTNKTTFQKERKNAYYRVYAKYFDLRLTA